jgi:FtsP/CotA-like multicopper oxidase with cupredoxin domain
MSYKKQLFGFSGLCLLTLAAVFLTAGPSFAAEYWMCAKPFDMTMPDASVVPMWGFALSNSNFADDCKGPATVPGPKLTVGVGDTTLTIHLRNDLTGPYIEPVSIVIPGQAMPVSSPPVFAGNRVRSFVQEAATGGTQTYTWSSIQPGTYLYQSGTHPQVQVQMGLYGALTKDSAASTAYPGVTYIAQQDLFFSEVDPALHAAVDGGTYGTPPGPTSTLNYKPKYFLLHSHDGTAWVDVTIGGGMQTCLQVGGAAGSCIDSGISLNQRLLLRMYNAGLRELAPMLIGSHFDLVAEGGKKYPFVRTQYQTLLMPGSTQDAIFTPGYNGAFKLIERRLNLANAPATSIAPVANSQSVSMNEDTSNYPITLTASGAGPLTYSLVSGSGPSNGTLAGSAPNLSYTPNLNFFGSDSFKFTANDGSADSNQATVSITVNPVNDPPSFTKGPDQTVAASAGSQTVPTWATNISDGPANEASQTVTFVVTNGNNGLFSAQPAVSSSGTLTYTPGSSPGSATVSIYAQDNGGTVNGGINISATQTFTITVQAAAATVHVGDLDGSRNDNIGGNRWRATVAVEVHSSQNHAVVANATVTGTWNAGDANGRTLSCTTGDSGRCNVTSGRLSDANNAEVIFTVTNVTSAGSAYVSDSNHDPDASPQNSNGTFIKVPRLP